MSTEKTCKKCGVTKPLVTGFFRSTARIDGYAFYCKACDTAKAKAWRNRSGYHKKAYEQAVRNKSRYGITWTEYQRLLEKQAGGCAICGVIKLEDNKALAIDHDHQTGKVRGLLCRKCNIGLGQLQDSKELLTRAIAYLQAAA